MNFNVFRDADTYIDAQERTLRFVPEDELESFVLPSIDTLTTEHLEPIVHETSKTVPESQEPWLRTELINHATNVMANPPLEGTLPARVSNEVSYHRSNSLLIPMDGRLLKIITGAAFASTPSDYISAHITEFSHANDNEAADYREKRAALHDLVDPNATIIIPRKTVEYYRRSVPADDPASYLHRSSDNDTEAMHSYSSRHSEPRPEDFLLFHKAFMKEARVALIALYSLVKR